jgi:hypothetical protein
MPHTHPHTAVATGNPLYGLTDKERLFCDHILKGATQTVAARSAGYCAPNVEGVRLMKKEKIKVALHYLHKKYEKASQMTRKKVMEGFTEAIEMARAQGEPATMVNGWREIGRMCGYYAPEKKILDVNVTAKRAVDVIETMSDAELLEMIENDSEAIEGEFSEILESAQTAEDEAFEEAGFQ